jgi:hypothetical protein
MPQPATMFVALLPSAAMEHCQIQKYGIAREFPLSLLAWYQHGSPKGIRSFKAQQCTAMAEAAVVTPALAVSYVL